MVKRYDVAAIKLVSVRAVMYSIVMIVSKILLYIQKLLTQEVLKVLSFPRKKKVVMICGDGC